MNTRKRKKEKVHIVFCLGMAVVVGLLAIVLFVGGRSIAAQNEKDAATLEKLEAEIESESERTEELEEYGKYVNTMQYYEEVAREKLGLIYEDEKVFKSED